MRALTEMLQSILFKDVPIKEFPEKVDHRSYKVSFDSFEREAGFKAEVSLVGGVGEIADNIRNGAYGNPRDDQYFRVKYLLKKGMDALA